MEFNFLGLGDQVLLGALVSVFNEVQSRHMLDNFFKTFVSIIKPYF